MTNEPLRRSILVVHADDTVAVALEPLQRGQVAHVRGESITLVADVPAGHKFARRAMPAGSRVLKYGLPMGRATSDIAVGEWVHTHNVETRLAGAEEYAYTPDFTPVPAIDDGLAFEGYARPNGDVGIRNEIWVLPTVGCVNELAQSMARRVVSAGLPEHVDAVHVFTHPFGCSQLGDDLRNTRTVLAALARHPNAAGVLVIGLGCENNDMAGFREVLADASPDRYRFLVAQESANEVAEGQRALEDLVTIASRARRTTYPVSRLRVGLKCGGSDGFSGLTANPLVGVLSDALVARGGAAVLTEVPEMFGAEALFMNRCATPEVFAACAGMLNDFKAYFLRHGQVVYENPSPGNKAGGITTLEEKSLGCLQKGGTTPIVDVLPYGGQVTKPGLSLLNGPGNDIVSVTALAAAGVHLVLFTTGRGTPLGGVVPTVKIASNPEIAARKPHWIDFDAGRLLQGESMTRLGAELLDLVTEVASGRQLARNEINGFREMAIFKDGVTL